MSNPVKGGLPTWETAGPEYRNELAVIGAALTNPDRIVDLALLVKVEMFTDPNLGFVFRAMKSVHDRGQVPDVQLVDTEMYRLDGELADSLGGLSFLRESLLLVRDAANGLLYAREVANFYTLRRMKAAFETLAMQCRQWSADVEELLGKAERDLLSLREVTAGGNEMKRVVEIGRESLQFYRKLKEEGKTPMGYPTGLKELDLLMGGLRPGELALVVGRPSDGKSALALNMAMSCALAGVPTVYFSLEMTYKEVVGRLFCKVGNIRADSMRIHGLSLKELEEMNRVNEEVFEGLPFLLDYPETLSMDSLRAKVTRLVKMGLCKVMFVDYLNMMKLDRFGRDSVDYSLGALVNALKTVAVQLNIPVVGLSQMNRDVEKREGNMPELADIRDSGNFEQAADIVMFVRNPERHYNPKRKEAKPEKGVGEIHIKKCRDGAQGFIRFRHNVSFSKIGDY